MRDLNTKKLASCVVHVLYGSMTVCLKTPRETSASLENNIKAHFANVFIFLVIFLLCLKVVSATFLLVCFLSLQGSTCEIRKNVFFFSLQKFFSFSRKSKFRILDIQISWLYQIPTYLWSKHSLLTKFGQFMSNYKIKNFIKNFYKKLHSEN